MLMKYVNEIVITNVFNDTKEVLAVPRSDIKNF